MALPYVLDDSLVELSERPHLMGSCEMCYLIRTGKLAKDSQLELLHRAVIVYLALPTNISMQTLHQRLGDLKISGCGQALPMLFLMREVLAHMHSARPELQTLQQIIPQVIFSSAPKGQPIMFRKKAMTVQEVAEVARSATMTALEGRLGILDANQGNASFGWAEDIDQVDNSIEVPTSGQSAVQKTAKGTQHPQLGVFVEKGDQPRNRARQRIAVPAAAQKPAKHHATYDADSATDDAVEPELYQQAAGRDSQRPVKRERTVLNDPGKLAAIVNRAREKQA